MRYIYNRSTDPAFNLAAEEWLLNQCAEDVFMLWRNEPAVIVGRNQNTISQIDETFVRERNIPVVRRLSGGGAVFHDLGNINFTFICKAVLGEGLDFQRFTAPIQKALQGMGVDCSFEGRNDLLIDGKKFSGNAQHFHGGRVLHHGTLLYSSDMTDLSGALRVDPEKYKDKAVKSVKARVTNISSHLPVPMAVTEFISVLMSAVSGQPPVDESDLSGEEKEAVNLLAENRYRTWDWNFGYSPAYNFTRSVRTPGGLLEIHMEVKNGHILKMRLFGDYFGVKSIRELENLLIDCPHRRASLEERISGVNLEEYMKGVSAGIFLDSLF